MDSIKHMKWSGAAAAVLTGTMLLGCSVAGPRSSPLPQEGPTIVDIYRQHMQQEVGNSTQGVRERLPLREATDSDPGKLKKTALGGIENRFPRLYNPDLVMYVMPHLSKGKYPVPGYVTVFPMYETVEYAMPGEQAERRVSTPARRTEAPIAASAANSEAKPPSATK